MKSIVISSTTLLAAAVVMIAAEEKKSAETSAATMAASTTSEHQIHKAADLKWGEAPPGLPADAAIAVLDGDPGKAGSFTVRLKMPEGCKIMPHTHPTAERVTVISGTANIGMGDKFDESAGTKLEPGDFVVLPAGMKHFAWGTGETVVQIQSEGPFQINYVNPADDPRNAKK